MSNSKPNDFVEKLLAERQDARQEMIDSLPELLKQRKDREQKLSKTARESIDAFKKQEAQAEQALMVDFAVGGEGFLKAGKFSYQPGAKLGTCELYASSNGNLSSGLMAIRVKNNPLAPVFLISSDCDSRLKTQLDLFMKGYVIMAPDILLSIRTGI